MTDSKWTTSIDIEYANSSSDQYGSTSSSSASRSISPQADLVLDIRQKSDELTNLRAEILKGLEQPFGQKHVPALLLWDDAGQQLYDSILASGYYYPYTVEFDLLRKSAASIARHVMDSGTEIIVELGAGNMEKTVLLLHHLDALGKKLTYYALDVDRMSIERSLASFPGGIGLQNVQVRGLQGTYEDGAAWLADAEEARGKVKTVVWLGNSIANLKPHEAGELLQLFTASNGIQRLAGLIISVDGCQDSSLIEQAYDVPGGHTRNWMGHALQSAIALLGATSEHLLDPSNWEFAGAWDAETSRFENYLTSTRSAEATIDGSHIKIEKHEPVHVLGSGKWTEEQVESIAFGHDLRVGRIWSSEDADYGVYWLQPMLP